MTTAKLRVVRSAGDARRAANDEPQLCIAKVRPTASPAHAQGRPVQNAAAQRSNIRLSCRVSNIHAHDEPLSD